MTTKNTTQEHQRRAREANARAVQATTDERTVQVVVGVLAALKAKIFERAEFSSQSQASDALYMLAEEIDELIENPIELEEEK